MNELGFTMSGVSLLVAIVAWWLIWRLRRELSDSKRERYYLEQKVKSLIAHIEATVEPLRIQTALLAQGKNVSHRLIRSGQLYHEISANEAKEFLTESSQSEHVLWLDVRTTAEFSQRHIAGAIVIPIEELETRYRTEISPAIEKIVVYCVGGDRSRLACDFLSRHDFCNVYYMKDGLQAWTGPTEGNEPGGLIQITSKIRSSVHVGETISSSAHSI